MKNKLLEKFKHIGFLDVKKIDKELSKLKTIPEKLDYLKEVKALYFDKYIKVVNKLTQEDISLYRELYSEIRNRIFGTTILESKLQIQNPIYLEHFKKEENNPEFTFWFLKYNANIVYNKYINSPEFKTNFGSDEKKRYLQADLKRITDIEEVVFQKLNKREINSNKNYRKTKGFSLQNNPNIRYTEVLRVLDGYYKDHVTQLNFNTLNLINSNILEPNYDIFSEDPTNIADDVKAYATHIYLKNYLEVELKKFENPIDSVHNKYELSAVLKEEQESVQLLKEIWLPESKLTVNDFLNKGIECAVWNKNYEIILSRGSVYGSGKSFLGSLAVALKSYSISNNTDYKVIGKAFCRAFKIDNLEKSSNPYKSFQVGNRKYIKELKRAFNIK